jgi:hypothetical protein
MRLAAATTLVCHRAEAPPLELPSAVVSRLLPIAGAATGVAAGGRARARARRCSHWPLYRASPARLWATLVLCVVCRGQCPSRPPEIRPSSLEFGFEFLISFKFVASLKICTCLN